MRHGLAGGLVSGVGIVVLCGAVTAAWSEEKGSAKEKAQKAAAALTPTQGSTVKGKVTFTKEAAGIRVVADIEGLEPGDHGFHIHEKGDCSAPDGTSAGGHFNPTGDPHAAPDAAKRHEGDLGNVKADAAGKVHVDKVDAHLSLEGDASILGRAVIVHAKADDFQTQPTGNAGARAACGVIQ